MSVVEQVDRLRSRLKDLEGMLDLTPADTIAHGEVCEAIQGIEEEIHCLLDPDGEGPM